MPPCNSHGDWPFLRPPERFPEVPVLSREHLWQLEKIPEVLPSRRDEAHFRGGVSRLINLASGTSKGSFTPLLQLKNFPVVPVSTREEARESCPHPEKPRFRLIAREEESFPCVVGKEFPVSRSHLKRRRSPQETRGDLQGRDTIPRVPQMSQSIPGKPVFPALPRLSSRGSTHTTVARGTAQWESLVGKPRGKASRESHRSLDPREGKRDTAATAREQIARACPHSRRGLTPLGRLQKYPKIHVSPGEKSSGSGTDSTQGLGHGIDGRGIPRGHRATRMGLAFPEATRAGP